MKILVTGSAGFIGFHLTNRLLNDGHVVTGVDSLNHYYDVYLKIDRLQHQGIERSEIAYKSPVVSHINSNYTFWQVNLEDKETLLKVFKNGHFDVVINLAAQAGVRYSLTHPEAYVNSNIAGFLSVLECCRHYHIKHLVFASSSSVYGLNQHQPSSTSDNTDHPVSIYAASKKSNELMAHAYSHLFSLPVTGLRFFTVYGPWGRPDMAFFIFTKAIAEGRPIRLFNEGNMLRDFTYVDDIVEGVVRVMNRVPEKNPSWSDERGDISSSTAPYKIYNIGNNTSVKLIELVEAIENELGKKAIKEFKPMQPGDVVETFADVDDLMRDIGYQPSTDIKHGIKQFVKWYKEYYKVK